MKFMPFLLSAYLLIGYSNSSLCASSDISVRLSSTPENITRLLRPLWQDLQYQYRWGKKSLGGVSDIVKAQLIKADLSLARTGSALFNASTLDTNILKLNWQLQNLEVNALIKIRFKFRQYGVQITHDEYFKVQASDLNKAITSLRILYNRPMQTRPLQFTNIKHQNFTFKKVSIIPRDGIGNILRFIFDNIFSKKKVEHFIKEKINQELQLWINKNELIAQLESSINDEIYTVQNTPWRPEGVPWSIYPKLDLIQLKNDIIQFNSSYYFDTSQARVHTCAEGMLKNKNDINLSTEFIQKLINSLATYEIYANNTLQEPLFCFGYKSYNDQGEAIGENASIRFMNKNIQFTYWIKPNQAPKYHFDPINKIISIALNLQIIIKSNGYPKLRAINDKINAQLSLSYELGFTENDGLKMSFKKLNLNELKGTIKLKWLPYTPWFKLSNERIRRELNKSLNYELNQTTVKLMSDKIILSDELILQLTAFNLEEKGLRFFFELTDYF